MQNEHIGDGLFVQRPLGMLRAPVRPSAAEEYAAPLTGPALPVNELLPRAPHKEAAELYAVSALPSTPNPTVRYLFAASLREPLPVSKLLAAYPNVRTVVVRELHADVPLGEHLQRLFIFDKLVSDAKSFLHQVTHLHIDVAAAYAFHQFCKTHTPWQTFVALRFFSIALHIEDAAAGHYDALIGAVAGCNLGFDSALVHVLYGSRADPTPYLTVAPSLTFTGGQFVDKDCVYHVLRHAKYRRDAVELRRRDAWGEERGVWHNKPPA